MDCRSTFLARGFVSVPLRGKEGAGLQKIARIAIVVMVSVPLRGKEGAGLKRLTGVECKVSQKSIVSVPLRGKEGAGPLIWVVRPTAALSFRPLAG